MANHALGKLPLEKDKWKKPEAATDGIITGYNGHNGFASANHPVTYTLDFGEPVLINSIRFLLWDGMGEGDTRPNARKYRFSLSISNDGINFITLYSNQNQDGSNGWYTFDFLNSGYERFVRLDCLSNTANEAFHIVEFEVHDNLADEITSTNHQKFTINHGLPGYDEVFRIVEEAIDRKSESLNSLIKKAKEIDKAEERLTESLKLVDLLGKSKTFHDEAEANKNRANNWLIAAAVTSFVFIVFMICFLWFDCKPFNILDKSKTESYANSHTTLILSFYYLSKAVFISVILFVLGWELRNYKSERHNYVINKHKAISLITANGILVNPEYQDFDKKEIFKEALSIVFSHQNTGFSKEDKNQPNSIINTITEKGLS